MAFSFKRTVAAAVALVCAASMCGCMDSGALMNVEGVAIPNGVYLSNVMSSYSDAYSKISTAKADMGDTSEIEDVFAETIDDITASEWIKADTLKKVKRYVAIEKLFEEYGLSLSAEETDALNADLNSMWDEENMYAQYIYGFDTMGEYYESIGVSKDSMKAIYTNQSKENEVFSHLYDTNGVNAVAEDELTSYIIDNYAVVKYLQLEYKDKYGITLKDEASIQAIKDTAKSYVDRLNGGESYVDVKYDYDLKAAQNKASADAEDAYADLEGELPDFDTYIQEAVDSATATKLESADELDVFISKESSTLNEELTNFIWNNVAADGAAHLLETENASYVVVREDITTKDNWMADNRTSVIGEIKGDEFEAMLEETYANYSVDADDYLVNNKYAPENIKGIE